MCYSCERNCWRSGGELDCDVSDEQFEADVEQRDSSTNTPKRRITRPALGPATRTDGERCLDPDEHSDEVCIRDHGHGGAHQSRLCDATCDTCECLFWGNTHDDAGRPLPEDAR